ncbi:MAG: aminomethyl-transferring glycine dehydrogenase subunit GcvPB, partial [Pseudomonadota bacterium]
RFWDSMLSIAERAKAGDASMKGAPYLAPMKRLDETKAARKPVLKWLPPEPEAIAAE